jgi:hypothetical protein
VILQLVLVGARMSHQKEVQGLLPKKHIYAVDEGQSQKGIRAGG